MFGDQLFEAEKVWNFEAFGLQVQLFPHPLYKEPSPSNIKVV